MVMPQSSSDFSNTGKLVIHIIFVVVQQAQRFGVMAGAVLRMTVLW
jgi:hypothetical protein